MRLKVAGLLGIWLALAPTQTAAPQEPIRVDVHLINVGFSVNDARGRFVAGLKSDDFDVFEDGTVQKISFFAPAEDTPLSLGLVADFSGSQADSIKPHHQDLEKFLKTVLTARDRAFLLCFGNRLRVAADFTANPKTVMEGLENYEKGMKGKGKGDLSDIPEIGPREIRPPSGGTAFFDAIYESIHVKLGAEQPGRKALVIFSDGDDNSSARDELEAIEIAQQNNILLFCVRYTETAKTGKLTARNKNGMTVMEHLAHETGGGHYDARQSGLAGHFREIGDQLRASYELAYHTTNPVDDGSFHKLLIRAKTPGLSVRAKTGYYAR